MVHPLEMLADDVEVRTGHEMVDIGDTAGHGILDCNHRQRCAAFAHCRKGVIELRARQRRHVGKDAAAGQVGVGPEGALKGDRVRRIG